MTIEIDQTYRYPNGVTAVVEKLDRRNVWLRVERGTRAGRDSGTLACVRRDDMATLRLVRTPHDEQWDNVT